MIVNMLYRIGLTNLSCAEVQQYYNIIAKGQQPFLLHAYCAVLIFLYSREYAESVIGDVKEKYDELFNTNPAKARKWLIREALVSIPIFIAYRVIRPFHILVNKIISRIFD